MPIAKKRSSKISLKYLLSVLDKADNGKHSLSKVVGDGYLLENNPIFRNIRTTAIQHGYKFSNRPPFPYSTFPLLSLTKILKTKIIPYSENIDWLKELEHQQPHLFSLSDFRYLHPIKNYTLHESAHCIAESIVHHGKSEKEIIFKIMIAEAFANTSELMATQFADQNATDMWILNMNTYFNSPIKNFKDLSEKVGIESISKIVFFFFLYSNFLCEDLDSHHQKRIFDFIRIDPKIQSSKIFKNVINDIRKVSFGLNPIFRLLTTEFYLKSLGFNKNLKKILNYDPLRFIMRDKKFQKDTEDLCRIFS